MISVSVILPCYNEADNIVPLVNEILTRIPATHAPEVIIVDDNSPDGTYARALEAFGASPHVRCLLRTRDRGFAKSIRHGIESASGTLIVVMDTDYAHDPVELPNMLHLAERYDCIIGSRFCAGGNMPSLKRYLASMVYNWGVRIILQSQIQDNLSGFFCTRRQILMELDRDAIFQGYGEYFIRLLHHVQKRKHSVLEMPVVYRERIHGESKSNFFKMAFTYGLAAFMVKLRLRSRH
jgi:dolichol-phosphate mannosyltransferase